MLKQFILYLFLILCITYTIAQDRKNDVCLNKKYLNKPQQHLSFIENKLSEIKLLLFQLNKNADSSANDAKKMKYDIYLANTIEDATVKIKELKLADYNKKKNKILLCEFTENVAQITNQWHLIKEKFNKIENQSGNIHSEMVNPKSKSTELAYINQQAADSDPREIEAKLQTEKKAKHELWLKTANFSFPFKFSITEFVFECHFCNKECMRYTFDASKPDFNLQNESDKYHLEIAYVDFISKIDKAITIASTEERGCYEKGCAKNFFGYHFWVPVNTSTHASDKKFTITPK